MPTHETPGLQRRVISILDSTGLVVHVVDSRTQETVKLDIGQFLRGEASSATGVSCPVPSEAQSQPEATLSRELLGTKIIEGFPCRGLRVTMGQEQSDQWLSSELAILLLEETKSPECQIIYRVFDITLGEPEPGLFLRSEA